MFPIFFVIAYTMEISDISVQLLENVSASRKERCSADEKDQGFERGLCSTTKLNLASIAFLES